MANMDTQDDLNALRDDLIKRIKAVFPKQPRAKGNLNKLKVAKSGDRIYRKEVETVFGGKRWEDVIGTQGLAYKMSDVDYLWSMTPKAFAYYLPALLVTTLYSPSQWGELYSYFFVEFSKAIATYSVEQLETLIMFADFQARWWQGRSQEIVDQVETMQLQLMLLLDKKKQK